MTNAYVLVVLGIILAKGIGFYRDMVFAGTFGTGTEADIYFQVFGLVNLIFTGIGVALSTLVIKNSNKAENSGHEKEYAAGFICKSLIYLIFAAALFVIFAKQIVGIILPELSGEGLSLAIRMMHIMAPSLIFVVIAYIMSGILQNEKVYFITAIMSLPFNAVIIASLLVPDVSIITVGIVTTVGWFLHIAILLPSFLKKGYSFTAKLPKKAKVTPSKNPEIIWIFISNMMFQLCFYADRAFVSSADGMASTFSYASNLFVTISSIFVVAMSTVFFPSISKNYEEGNIDYINSLLRYLLTVTSSIFLPFLLVSGLFGNDIIRLVYERGSFTPESTAAVSSVFFIYCLGILGYISQELFNKILYLAGKYMYCVTGTICVVVINALTNFAIARFIPEKPIEGYSLTNISLLTAISTAFYLFCYAAAIAIAIKKVVGPYWKKDLLINILKVAVSGGAAFCVYLLFNTLMPTFTHGYISFVIPLCACGIVYVGALFALGVLKQLFKIERKG